MARAQAPLIKEQVSGALQVAGVTVMPSGEGQLSWDWA